MILFFIIIFLKVHLDAVHQMVVQIYIFTIQQQIVMDNPLKMFIVIQIHGNVYEWEWMVPKREQICLEH